MKVGIALGSNLGDRGEQLEKGFRFLKSISVKGFFQRSSIYRTQPVDCPPGSPAFLNAAAVVDWDGSAEELLDRLQRYELDQGRAAVRAVNSPRPIDLDVLYFGEEIIESPRLRVPHPRITQRRFVLEPLCDLNPHLILPDQERDVAECLKHAKDESMPQKMWTADEIALCKVRKIPVPVLTAYDYPTARLLDEAGLPMILVGDSLGMVTLGFPDTTCVTLEMMEHHTAAVARAETAALVVADLPYRSYETSEMAVTSAKRLIKAGARAVKLEGGQEMVPQLQALRDAGIRVMGHIGMLPQQVRVEGGYKIKGKTDVERKRMLEDAKAIEEAGVFAMVLELVIPDLAKEITRITQVPTIGIGSGVDCDGQILVVSDLVGAFPWFRPKFVTPTAEIGLEIRKAAENFVATVNKGR